MNAMHAKGLTAALAAELSGARAAARMTIDLVAASTGISKSSLLRLFNARREITMQDIARLGELFDVEPVELMRRAQERLDRS